MTSNLENIAITYNTLKRNLSVLCNPPVFDNPVLFALRCGPIAHCQDSVVDAFLVTAGVIIHTWEKITYEVDVTQDISIHLSLSRLC